MMPGLTSATVDCPTGKMYYGMIQSHTLPMDKDPPWGQDNAGNNSDGPSGDPPITWDEEEAKETEKSKESDDDSKEPKDDDDLPNDLEQEELGNHYLPRTRIARQ